MTKLLNLDEFADNVERVISHKGDKFPVKDFTVRESMQFSKLWTAMDKAMKEESEEKMVALCEEIIKFGCPTLPDETIATLKPAQLFAAVHMVAGFVPKPPPKEGEQPAEAGEGSSGN